jgi:hypothetical protein
MFEPGARRAASSWLLSFLSLASIFACPIASAIETPDDRDKTLPCRPTIACTADFVPPGTFELETGALFRSLGPAASRTRQWSLPFLAKLTMARWIQLQLGSSGYTAARGAAPEAYFDDVVAGAKLHLLDQGDRAPSVSLSGSISVPTFRGQTGYIRTYDALFTAYVTKDFGPVHADFNASFNAWRVDGVPLGQESAALALSANMPPPFGIMGEAYYFTDARPIAPRDGGFLFAFTHSPRSWLVFDVGADVGWFPSARAYSLFVGASVIPAVFWRGSARDMAPHGGGRLPARGAIM